MTQGRCSDIRPETIRRIEYFIIRRLFSFSFFFFRLKNRWNFFFFKYEGYFYETRWSITVACENIWISFSFFFSIFDKMSMNNFWFVSVRSIMDYTEGGNFFFYIDDISWNDDYRYIYICTMAREGIWFLFFIKFCQCVGNNRLIHEKSMRKFILFFFLNITLLMEKNFKLKKCWKFITRCKKKKNI